MNPLTVTIFDINRGQAVTQFLNMCTTSSATAAAIYDTMDKTLVRLLKSTNPWTMHKSVGVYNTSVNIDTRNSLQTRIVKRNDAPVTLYIILLQMVMQLLPSIAALTLKSLQWIYFIGSTNL